MQMMNEECKCKHILLSYTFVITEAINKTGDHNLISPNYSRRINSFFDKLEKDSVIKEAFAVQL